MPIRERLEGKEVSYGGKERREVLEEEDNLEEVEVEERVPKLNGRRW